MTSVTDILKEHGKWLETSALVIKITKKLNIGERQAYRMINKEWKDKEIVKLSNPDRTVYCGLPEFGPLASGPESSFQEALILRCFKQLDEINEKNSTGNSLQAFQGLCSFIKTLPSHLKNKLDADVQQAKQAFFPYMDAFLLLEELKNSNAYQNNPRLQLVQAIVKRTTYGYVEYLVEKVSMLLHEESERLHEDKEK
jgi:hypothetical protein